MNKKGLAGAIFFGIFVVVIISALILVAYQQHTSEYKYTAIIPCYDKYGNEIVDLICERDISCGWGQNYDNDNMQSYPCDKDKYDGEFVFGRVNE